MRKAISLIACACVAAAVAPATAPAAAKPAKTKTAKFLVSVQATQVTTWNEPQHDQYRDCQGQRWTRGGGEEVVAFRTKKPVRALITLASGRPPSVKLGTWKRLSPGSYFLPAIGRVERVGEKVYGIEPSVCFDDGPTEWNTGPYDCGQRSASFHAYLNWTTDRLGLNANAGIGTIPRFENCPLYTASRVAEAGFTDETLSDPFPAKDLFHPKFKVHEILGGQDFADASLYQTTSTKVRWKVRFQRVK